jgi:SAM-dependent MidA family methyltransferase
VRPWKHAMAEALYAPGAGFYTRPDSAPGHHFRTTAQTGHVVAGAMLRLVSAIDAELGSPHRLDLVDVGAGRGELLRSILAAAGADLRRRLRPVAVELGVRPPGWPGDVSWQATIPARVHGVLIATEWLDNVPLDIAVRTGGAWRYVVVDDRGREASGNPVDPPDAAWIAQWWPDGVRVEIGRTRDAAWADAVAHVDRGFAVAVDYGHLRADRPPFGTLTGYAGGREAAPVPDGSVDLTAHIAADAVASAGGSRLLRQADALAALGISGRRPPIARAHRDPAAYVRALADASTATEVTDRDGFGSHWWLLTPVGVDGPPTMTR